MFRQCHACGFERNFEFRRQSQYSSLWFQPGSPARIDPMYTALVGFAVWRLGVVRSQVEPMIAPSIPRLGNRGPFRSVVAAAGPTRHLLNWTKFIATPLDSRARAGERPAIQKNSSPSTELTCIAWVVACFDSCRARKMLRGDDAIIVPCPHILLCNGRRQGGFAFFSAISSRASITKEVP